MHTEALAWVFQWRGPLTHDTKVVEFGARNINGSVRELFAGVGEYVGVDLEPGRGVDVVHDAATVDLGHGTYDVVVCCEMLEHTPDGASVVANALRHLRPQGRFVATAAGPGREPHSADDGGDLADGEHYGNVDPGELDQWLSDAGFASWTVDTYGDDVRCVAWR